MNRRARLWPVGLTGRVIVVLLVAIMVEFLATVLVFGESERLLVRTGQAQRVAEQLVVAERVLATTPPAVRPDLARRLSTQHVSIGWTPDAPSSRPLTPFTQAAERVFRSWEPSLAGRQLYLRTAGDVDGNGHGSRIFGALALPDGSWLRFRSVEPVARWYLDYRTLLSMLFVALAVVAVAALLVRTLAAPLGALADVADRIGREQGVVELVPDGPGELRRVAVALNAMQHRIRQLIDDRTQALVAVSHDLRTPLARLKLRLAERGDDRAGMRDDLEEMDAMLHSLFEFMRGGDDRGETVRSNLASLVITEVEREEDLGRPVRYDGPARLDADLHPVPIRRALANLIENALKYGGSAEVSLAQADGAVRLSVRDRGPGMPDAELAEATRPFVRGDAARARDTRGLGLGLAIVAQVAALHDGTLDLANADGGGLIATLMFPAQRTA